MISHRFHDAIRKSRGETRQPERFPSELSPLALGLGLSTHDPRKRTIYFSLAAFVGITVFLTLYRGGIIAFVAGQIFLTTMPLMKRAEKHGGAGGCARNCRGTTEHRVGRRKALSAIPVRSG